MKKTIAYVGAVGAFSLAGLGVTGVASAQSDADADADADSTESSDESTDDAETTEDGEGRGSRDDGETREGHDSEGRSNRGGNGCGGEALAELLGVEVDDLRARIKAGETLADIAEENGISAEDLVDLMVSDTADRLDEKVAEGDLTQEEAAGKLAAKSERIEDQVFGTDDDDADEADEVVEEDEEEIGS